MTNKNHRDVTPDDFNNFEDVPTYEQAGSTSYIRADKTSSIYERTGKAAPTEVFPRSAGEPTRALVNDAGATTNIATGPAAVSAEPQYIEPQYIEPQYIEPEYAEPEYVEPEAVAVEPEARRGTIDLGLLLLRLVLGGYLIFHSIQTFFRLGASEGIAGLESAFAGYAYGDVLAIVVPTLELAAGVFIVLGLLGPVAAMVAIAVTGFMAAHAAVSSGAGFNALAWDAAVWLPVILFGVSLAHQFTGPGFYAVDSGRSWARRPLASSWIFAVLGIAAAALMWWFGTGVNPVA